MKISQPGQARALHYDRNPLAITRSYNALIGPLGPTVRWTYTVPANRKLMLERVHAFMIRITAAAPVGEYAGWIWSDAANVYHALLESLDNTVGGKSWDTATEQAVLPAGTVIDGRTNDPSTGGTVEYALSMRGTEFDA